MDKEAGEKSELKMSNHVEDTSPNMEVIAEPGEIIDMICIG